MSMVINTNIGAENAVRLMDKTSRAQATTMERLTSGQRINSSKDDSSGLSVATNMTVQSRGLVMAANNANDGINLIQTGDGALDDATSLFQRMRELGLQAMNSTYTSTQRQDMNEEFQQLNGEIARIASITKFNNLPMLNTASGLAIGNKFEFQVGWEVGAQNKIAISAFSLTGVTGTLSTMAQASAAVVSISTLLQSIQTTRAKWGAVVNRLENAILNLHNMDEQVKKSRSRILDTDYAKESAELARVQVLQQAGQAMLSQANQASQSVMSLLK